VSYDFLQYRALLNGRAERLQNANSKNSSFLTCKSACIDAAVAAIRCNELAHRDETSKKSHAVSEWNAF